MLLVSFSGLVTLMSGSMMAPALSEVAQDLSLNEPTAQLSLSIYVLSYAIGPMLLAPISELYGRRPIWLFCGCFYILWNTVCGFAQNNATMIAARWLAGIGASAEFAVSEVPSSYVKCGSSGSLALPSGSTPSTCEAGFWKRKLKFSQVTLPVLADTWRPEQRGEGYALSSAIPLLGTAIGPIIGGEITQALGWRWLFWVVSIFAGSNTIAGFFFFPETYAPVLLTRKARALRKTTGRDYYTEFERSTKSLRAKLQISMLRPFRMLLTQPTIQFTSLLSAYSFGINYIMLSTFAELWTERYDQSVGQSGLNYIAIAVGNTIAAQVGARILDRIYAHLKKKNGDMAAPEYRVPLMVPGWILAPIGLFWYGWAGETKAYWLVTDIGVSVFACGIILGMQSTSAYVIDSYLPYTASAYAASQLLRCIAAFVFPIWAPELYNKLGYGWGNSLLGFFACAFGLPAPLILWKYGAWLRHKGRPLQ